MSIRHLGLLCKEVKWGRPACRHLAEAKLNNYRPGSVCSTRGCVTKMAANQNIVVDIDSFRGRIYVKECCLWMHSTKENSGDIQGRRPRGTRGTVLPKT